MIHYPSLKEKRVLFQSRTTLFSVPGGDTVQILKTKEFLELHGICVEISTELEPDLTGYDLVHLFNLIRPQEVLTQARNAKRQGKRVALSTIYGLYTEYDRKARTGVARWVSRLLSTGQLEYLKTCARALKNAEYNRGTLNYLALGHLRAQREIVRLVDLFLPNSQSEMERVWEDFPESRPKPYQVVPNAVDLGLFRSAAAPLAPEVERFRDCVLCVARIEGRKNQLNLVRAMRDLPWPLVLIGKAAPNHRAYYDQIEREAGGNVHLLGQVDHALLPQFYQAAKVHCLISWMETPGLSSLEAAAMGCNVVVTEKGDPRDYFGELAYYCEPDSVPSIRDAVVRAHQAPVDPALAALVQEKYTWQQTAQKTMDGYLAVL